MRARDLKPLDPIQEPATGEEVDFGALRWDQALLTRRLNDLLAIVQELEAVASLRQPARTDSRSSDIAAGATFGATWNSRHRWDPCSNTWVEREVGAD